MKITLKNFRCHENETFTIEDSGLILLTGNSGSGKSTLLKAIIYALYGKIRKPYTFGTKSCGVTLEFMDMIITRTSNPNTITVNGMEGDAAQSYINERMGMTHAEFMLSSYIPQKNNTSLLSLAQTEQIAAIKMIAFKDDQNENLSKKLKGLIKHNTEISTNLKSKVELATTEVDLLQSQIGDPVQFPLTVGDLETIDECIQNYRERLKTFNSRISILQKDQQALKTDLANLKTAQDQIALLIEKRDANKEQLDALNDHIKKCKEELEGYPIDLDSRIANIKNHLKCLEKRVLLEGMENTLKVSIESEIAIRNKKIQEIGDKLWKDNDGKVVTQDSLEQELQDNEHLIDEYNDYTTKKEIYDNAYIASGLSQGSQDSNVIDTHLLQTHLLHKVEAISREIDDLNNKKTEWAIAIERVKIEKEKIYCPKCNTGLRFNNGKLSCVDKLEHADVDIDYKELIQNATKKIRLLESERKGTQSLYNKVETLVIPEIEQLDSEFYDDLSKRNDQITKFIREHRDLQSQKEKLQKELDSEYFGVAIKNMKDAFAKETKKFEEMLMAIENSDLITTRDDLDAKLAEIQDLKVKRTLKVTEITGDDKRCKVLNDTHISLSKKITDLNHSLSGINRASLIKKLDKVEKAIEVAKVKQDEDTEITEQVDKYLWYMDKLGKLQEWTDKMNGYQAEYQEVNNKLTGFLGLKDMLVKAEVLAVDNVINTINEHTAYYLDTFFSEHKLSAVIGTSPEAKFSNVIEYKGNEYAGVNELSGGEFDRVTLASICGVNSMLNSPILMLDESLSSLDAETNTEIINFLHELSGDKLILVCSHEAVTGIFDEVIDCSR